MGKTLEFHVTSQVTLFLVNYFILQFAKENPLPPLPPQVKIKTGGDITEEAIQTTLIRAVRFYSTIQTQDGYWPGDYGGPMFLMPGLVSKLNSMFVSLPSFILYVHGDATEMYMNLNGFSISSLFSTFLLLH